MKQNTHLAINPSLVGKVEKLEAENAVVTLLAAPEMAADQRGLVHGGFTFGLADYAVMLAVNDPNVVLGGASVKFLKPVAVGQLMRAEAVVTNAEGKKRIVKVTVTVDGAPVMEGELTAFVLPKHVLD
ncbi:PaaI family thioesterase [bacterium]|nr:MAG: PaaI family thioesterase [bacterium]